MNFPESVIQNKVKTIADSYYRLNNIESGIKPRISISDYAVIRQLAVNELQDGIYDEIQDKNEHLQKNATVSDHKVILSSVESVKEPFPVSTCTNEEDDEQIPESVTEPEDNAQLLLSKFAKCIDL